MSENKPVTSLVPRGAINDPDGIPLQVMSHTEKGGVKVVTVCRADVTLTTKGGGITVIQEKAEIDSEGYRKLNRVTGLHILTPPTVIVDCKEVGNPHYERNPHTKSIQRVVIRKAVAGLSPLGKYVVVDKTLHFDTAMYLNQSLVKLVEKFGAAGCMGTLQNPPEHFTIYRYDKEIRQTIESSTIEAPIEERLRFFPLHEADFGVWLDVRHPEVVRMWENFTQMMQFVSRRAETTVIRLCFQEHPAIGAKRVKIENGKAKVPVFFHQDGLTPDQVRQLEAGMRAGGVPKDAPQGIEFMSSTVDGEVAAEVVSGDIDDASSEGVEVAGAINEDETNQDEGVGYGD